MRLVSYIHPLDSSPRAGVIVGDERVVDLHAASHGELPADLRQLLCRGPSALALAGEIARRAPGAGLPGLAELPALTSLRLLPPVSDPGKVLCVALNFQSHIDECRAHGMDFIQRTDFPLISPKVPSALTGHEHDIVLPPGGRQLDYEVELALVISKRCRAIARDDWRSYVAGFCVSVDLCLREIAFRPNGVFEGKNYDGFLPLGPYLVTPDEAPDPATMILSLSVNGQLRQSEPMANALFDLGAVLEYWSARMTLEAGDVFTLGTPSGVGIFHADPSTALLQPGDVIEASISGVGLLRNRIIAPAGARGIE
jgi:acylpyruvate hydrolase